MIKALACIIPARSGSKRLPNKNIYPFFGHPLIAYTIAAARASKLFARIVVSTDDPRIGSVAEHYGAEYLQRPLEFATDSAGLIEVAEHFLSALAKQGFEPNAFCQLMPNCPLRRAEDVVAQWELFEAGKRSFQISVVPYRGVYPHWAVVLEAANSGRWLFGDKFLVPSQRLTPHYCPTGAVWWVTTKAFRCQRKFYGEPFHLALMDPNRGMDIDNPDDLELAELVVRGLRERDGISPLQPIAQHSISGTAAYPTLLGI